MNEYQLAVLGGGPGGYTAAVRADQLGIKCVVIEKYKLGGTCLNWGCIPTKAILSGTDLLNNIKRSEEFGIRVEKISFDLKKMIERKNSIVSSLVGGLDKLFKMRKIPVITQTGKLTGQNEITLDDGKTLTADNIIIATGSEPLELPFFNIDHINVVNSTDALDMEEVPENMLIIGGGVVGCEFAGIFSSLGVKVTVVEMLGKLLPEEDDQISRTLKTSFRKQNIDVRLKTKVENVEIIDQGKVSVKFSDGTENIFSKVLSAGGRALNTKNIGIEQLGIETESGRVKINDYMQTSIPNIYAVGDITGKLMLAHAAAGQGITAASHISGKEEKIDYTSIPSAVFTSPEIASVGHTEQYLKSNGIKYKTGRFSFAANGKAKGLGETEGFVKVLTDEKGVELLGAHIIGPHASDLIHELVLVRQNKMPLDNLIKSIHAHPTLSECVLEASESVFKKAIHSL